MNSEPSVIFNISIHAPFEELNRLLFELFICGSLTDKDTGLTFSLSNTKSWKFIIEVPHTGSFEQNIKYNLNNILPLISIIGSCSIEVVTGENYQLCIGEEEELVARFLKAYYNKLIDQKLTLDLNGAEEPVDFVKLTDADECRHYIYKCINTYAPELPKNKIFEVSFVKFLYRRVQFFTGYFYRFNTEFENLGSITITQMIREAQNLAQIDFRQENYPRTYLVYDPSFSLQLLYKDWLEVPVALRKMFKNVEPKRRDEFRNKNYLAMCLSWLFDLQYETFNKIMNQTKFILTESFAYKLFHVHERKLTKLALIIEGETGVGKSFLLTFYSLLLNENIMNGSLQDNIAPRIHERTSIWLLKNIISDILEKEPNLLRIVLAKIRLYLKNPGDDIQNAEHHTTGTLALDENLIVEAAPNADEDDDDDPFSESTHIQLVNNRQNLLAGNHETEIMPIHALVPQAAPHYPSMDPIDLQLLQKIKYSLETFAYDDSVLKYIWATVMTVASENQMNTMEQLMLEFHNYATTQLSTLPLIEASHLLKNLLSKTLSSTMRTSIRMFDEFLCHTQLKPIFYRLLLHPGVTEKQLEEFMSPIIELAKQVPEIELVVFFDEINTSSCLGLFKEMFMDRTLQGRNLPKNIFFTAAINPKSESVNTDNIIHRSDYIVHQLPQALEGLVVYYGVLNSQTLAEYIKQKITMFDVNSSSDSQTRMPLENFAQNILAESILIAQEFCEKRLGN